MSRHIIPAALIAASLMVGCSPKQSETAATELYLNEKAPIEQRVEDLLSKMTVDEKISLMRSLAPAVERLGIEKYYHGNEALHGVVRPGRFTVYPQAIGLGAMWDPALVEEISGSISDEARARWNALDQGRNQNIPFADVLTFWSPTVNMARDPRWGRTAETYGEDPFLSGQTGAAFVRGLQGYDKRYLKVVSTPKHFAGNNEEHNRFECNADMPMKMIREYFLPAFEDCVREGHAESIMAAYNKINGMPCSCSHWLLTDLIRGEWGFDGYVVSDCGGVGNLLYTHHFVDTPEEAAAAALKAGLDLECGDNIYIEPLRSAYDKGLVSIEDIDLAVRRILTARMRLGIFDNPEHNPYAQIPESVIGCQKHQDLALKAARQSMVLLKNDGILPLDCHSLKKVAVVGINAANCVLGDYSGVPTIMPVSILQGVKDICGDNVEVVYAPWVSASNGMQEMDESCFADGLKAEYFDDTDWNHKTVERKESVLYFEPDNQAPDPLVPVHEVSVRWTGDIVADANGKYDFELVQFGGICRVYIDGRQVMGRDCPGGCSLDFTKGSRHHLVVEFSNERDYCLVKLNWKKPGSHAEEVYADAIEAARQSDVVIAAMGYNKTIEREGLDRPDLNLPADQEAFLKTLKAVNPNVVLVLVAGNSLSLNWEDENLPAILESWYGGEFGGQAVAEILFGKVNPSGKLPLTFYKGVEQLPAFDDYQVSNGRTYKYFEGEPLYEFGYGLSYTTFQYSGLKVSRHGKGWNVKFAVANTGDVAGDEVAQVYVRIPDYEGKSPIKELKGFSRVSLRPGEKKNVTVFIPDSRLRYWSDSENAFKYSSLKPEVMVGSSSADIRLK